MPEESCPRCAHPGQHPEAECILNLKRRAVAAEAHLIQTLESLGSDLQARVRALEMNADDYAQDQSTPAKLAHRQLTSHARYFRDYARTIIDHTIIDQATELRAAGGGKA